MSYLNISENDKKYILSLYSINEQKEVSPCPKGKKEDEFVSYDDIKRGKVIKKGYCNSSPNSGLVKVQNILKKLGYLKWEGLLGYYGDQTSDALIAFYRDQACSRQVDGTAIGPITIELLEDPDRYNRYFSNENIIAATIWGEARGEDIEGQKAIYTILKNRALKNKDPKLTITAKMAGEALRPLQFSYWNDKGFGGNPRCAKGSLGVNPNELSSYLEIVKNDITTDLEGATHYVNVKHATDTNKWWENKDKFKFIRRIGEHQFYKEV